MDGNWRDMFEPNRRSVPPDRASLPHREPDDADVGAPPLDVSEYRPWVLQRGRSRPPLMLDLRRFEAKSGLWMGWQVSYPHLVAVEYIGDQMLSLDFGLRQFMIEGRGLSELARHLQDGSVLAIQEYAKGVWSIEAGESFIYRISKL